MMDHDLSWLYNQGRKFTETKW